MSTRPQTSEGGRYQPFVNWIVGAIRGEPQFAWCEQKSREELARLIVADLDRIIPESRLFHQPAPAPVTQTVKEADGATQ
jgi:hypothetical protein